MVATMTAETLSTPSFAASFSPSLLMASAAWAKLFVAVFIRLDTLLGFGFSFSCACTVGFATEVLLQLVARGLVRITRAALHAGL